VDDTRDIDRARARAELRRFQVSSLLAHRSRGWLRVDLVPDGNNFLVRIADSDSSRIGKYETTMTAQQIVREYLFPAIEKASPAESSVNVDALPIPSASATRNEQRAHALVEAYVAAIERADARVAGRVWDRYVEQWFPASQEPKPQSEDPDESEAAPLLDTPRTTNPS
jgi:hypothetical protein